MGLAIYSGSYYTVSECHTPLLVESAPKGSLFTGRMQQDGFATLFQKPTETITALENRDLESYIRCHHHAHTAHPY